MPTGFTGKILHVDLTSGAFDVEQPDESFYRTYWGGSALGLYYLLKHTPAGADPLGPQNTLTFALSAPTGLPISGQSRATAVAKSPLTGLAGDSQAGGFWPAELKFAGFDALVIHGQSAHPVYLWIHDGRYELRDARHLWGLTTGETEDALRRELGDDKIEIAEIGPAGEKLARFAAIMNMRNRAHGRTGLGAVMGAKRLKAIAVRGTGKPSAARLDAIRELNKRGPGLMKENGAVDNLATYGTDNVLAGQNMVGGQPTHNFTSGTLPGAEALGGQVMAETILKQRDTCYACVVRCKRTVETEYAGEPVTPAYGGMEYETITMFGTLTGVTDLKAVALASQLCNAYGVDTMSCGATLAFAFECFQNGALGEADTGGLALNWGDADAMLALLRMTLAREGLGDVLAEGSARAAEKIGKGAERYVVAVKGQELPAHMPVVKRSLGLIYAVNPFGADHQSSEHDTLYMPKSPALFLERLAKLGLNEPASPKALNPAKVRFAYTTQLVYGVLDTLDLCQFVWGPAWQLYGPDELVELARASTGWEDVTLDELQALGARRLNLLRAFNAREGAGRDRDTLPARLFEPLKGGKTDGQAVPREEFEAALDQYYALAGWDAQTGMPRPETLERLGLGWASG
jgi:aldehyde:ferredoxin oxidoreductase